MNNLLFEIGTEELPASFQQPALDQLRGLFIKKVAALNISHGEICSYGTPRRLILHITDLVDHQPDRREEMIGPSAQAGIDSDGNYTKAAQGFARSKGGRVEDLQEVETDKGKYLMLVVEQSGQATKELLPDILTEIVNELNFPKSMKWGSSQFHFARPIQWILALFNDAVVPFVIGDIQSSNKTMGHRFMSHQEISISSAAVSDYQNTLREMNVLVDIEERKTLVVSEIKKAVKLHMGENAKVAIDDKLVSIITNLVEYPYGVCGNFDERFLALPEEVLITSMREHQKYFPVVDHDGKLLPAFVAVNNTKVKDVNLTRKGHEKVLRARLDDAIFFFNSDKKTKLADLVEKLSGIIFQAKLGTMKDKCDRLVKLSAVLADALSHQDNPAVSRAAILCKTDLLTDMVGEFPSLQGIMGQSYALADGEKESVSLAIAEHYLPKRAGSALPTSVPGALLGLADRLDTISGCFGIGQRATGTTDPFGLRRIAIAIIHTVEGFGFTISLKEMVAKSLALYGDKVDGGSKCVEEIISFIEGRYTNDLVAKGIDAEAVSAVCSVEFDDINDCRKRIDALADASKDERFPILAGSFKRIRNIVKTNESDFVDVDLLTEEAEIELNRVFEQTSEMVKPLLTAGNYSNALITMMDLKEPVDNFFESVMVMAEDDKVRKNRLNLLTAISHLFLHIGDISKMKS